MKKQQTQTGRNGEAATVFTSQELHTVAARQKDQFWFFVCSLALGIWMLATNSPVLLVLSIIGAIVQLFVVYRAATALKLRFAWAYALASSINLGYIGLIPYVGLMYQANRVLKQHGVRVGVLGANADDLRRSQASSEVLEPDPACGAASPPATEADTHSSAGSVAEQLQRLDSLLAERQLSEEDYNLLKNGILSQL